MPQRPESPDIVGRPPDTAVLRTDAIRVLVAGVNAWLVVIFVPLLFRPDVTAAAWSMTSASAVLLAAGAVTLPRWRGVATWILLASFPAALGATLAWSPRAEAGSMDETIPLLLAALSLAVFLAVAAQACARPDALRDSTPRPLAERDGAAVPPGRRTVRRWAFTAIVGVGAFGLAVVAPTWGSRRDLRRAWDEAAVQGEVLTAVSAGVLAVAILTLFVAPATRRRRKRRARRPGLTVRVALFLLLTVLGAYVYRVVG